MAKKRKPLSLFRVEGVSMVSDGATLYDHDTGSAYEVRAVKSIAGDKGTVLLVKAKYVGTAFDAKGQLIPCKLHPMGDA